MQSNLVNFIQVLRTHDVRVSPAETLDAVDVAATLGYEDRNLLRDGLAMTLAKTPEEEAVFLRCFDQFFSQGLSDFSNDEAEQTDVQSSLDQDAEVGDTEEASQDSESTDSETLQNAAEDNEALQSLLQTELMQNLMSKQSQ